MKVSTYLVNFIGLMSIIITVGVVGMFMLFLAFNLMYDLPIPPIPEIILLTLSILIIKLFLGLRININAGGAVNGIEEKVYQPKEEDVAEEDKV